MTDKINFPWVAVLLEQLWWCRQGAETIARCAPPELVCDPQALADYYVNPAQKRLNPLEFHGKRSWSDVGTTSHPRSNRPGEARARHAWPHRAREC